MTTPPADPVGTATSVENIERQAETFRARFDLLKAEVQKFIVGQDFQPIFTLF